MEPTTGVAHDDEGSLVIEPLKTMGATLAGPEASGGAGSANRAPRPSVEPEPPAAEKPCRRLPKVATSYPFRVHVLKRTEAGEIPVCTCGHQHMVYGETYLYCTCGLAAKQPFCDGTCRAEAPGFEPLELKCDKQQTYYLLCGW